ncbi:ATP-binding protein [Enterobacter roggenkampii]|uniref:ATP-binding protein n=2 Tax=Enterobacter roggenkampii TaxID=1812935 RepID=UPI00217DE59D|nr:ATP-binding protein [Enterobacter roggenkampii]UWI95091.1 ATP-binding protein [Enterobacter roggenkampii]
MLYITNQDEFHKNFSNFKISKENKVTGRFLILKNEKEQGIYFCDIAIVTKYNIDYYNDFTRVFLNDETLLDIKNNYHKLLNIKLTRENKLSIFTQVISDESYYKLAANYNKAYAKRLLTQLFDLGVMEKKGIFNHASNSAKNLLLLHNRSRYAFAKGVNFLFSENKKEYVKKTSLDDLVIDLPSIEDNKKIKLKFMHEIIERMPVNIFIGKNGSGKSYSIEKIIECYLRGKNQELSDNINKIIMISNTVNDNYPSTYKALQRLRNIKNDYYDDDYEYFSTLRTKKFNISEGVASFDLTSLINEMIKREVTEELPFSTLKILDDAITKNISCSIVGLDGDFSSFKSLNELSSMIKHQRKINEDYEPIVSSVFLVRDGKKIKLSSGQDNFILIISCILSSIQNNSLIFIDELENFLHPNFISQAIKILTQCLLETNSICIIATHSLHLAREIPRTGVNIFENINNKNKIVVYNPEIESYSCNLQIISNYIFNTKEESSLFDSTLRKVAKKYKNKKELISSLDNKLNREILLSIADRLNEN